MGLFRKLFPEHTSNDDFLNPRRRTGGVIPRGASPLSDGDVPAILSAREPMAADEYHYDRLSTDLLSLTADEDRLENEIAERQQQLSQVRRAKNAISAACDMLNPTLGPELPHEVKVEA